MSQVISETATLSDYWAIVRRHTRLVIVSAVVGGLLAAAWTYLAPQSYVSEASVVIGRIQSDPFAPTRIEDVGAGTERNVVKSTVVATRAARRLGRTDPVTLLEHVTVDNPVETLILDISFSASSAEAARDGAQAFALSYLSYRQDSAEEVKGRLLDRNEAQIEANRSELQTAVATVNDTTASTAARSAAEARRGVLTARIGDFEAERAEIEATDTTPGELIRPADLPTSPDGPGAALTIIGGLMLGLLAGLVLALIRDRADRRLLGHSDLVDLVDEEPLAEIPAPSRAERKATVIACEREPDGVAAGEYRRLRARVWPDRASGPRRVLVASPSTAGVADTVGANLGVTIASLGWTASVAWQERALPIALFGDLGEEDGALPDAQASITERIIVLERHAGLSLIPAIGRGPDASPLEATERHLGELEADIECQILLCDPILTSPQAVELAPLVDGVIVAFDVRETSRADLVRSLEILGTAKVIGVVALNVTSAWQR